MEASASICENLKAQLSCVTYLLTKTHDKVDVAQEFIRIGKVEVLNAPG
jgi:hypothetical protein